MKKPLKAYRLREEIEALFEELHKHQSRCKHRKVEVTHKSDTGNYCPQDDSYWIDAYCPVCLKKWTVDSNDNPEEYRRLGLLKYKKQKEVL